MNIEAKYSIWCEWLPHPRLARAEVLVPLARAGVRLRAAVAPQQVEDLPLLVRACRRHGVELGLWPLLPDGQGRWPALHNAPLFAAYVRRLLGRLERSGEPLPAELALDLEPPVASLRALLEGRPGAPAALLRRRSLAAAPARELLRGLVQEVQARGVAVRVVVVPLLLWDPPGGSGWQVLLGTPLFARGADHHSVMLYTSLLQGAARGLLTRADLRWLLFRLCQLSLRRLGPQVEVSLGLVGRGALGHETTYAGVEELRQDAAAARAAGIAELALYDLDGALDRPPAQRWLQALASAPPDAAPPRPTLRGRALLRALGGASLGARLLARAR